MQPPVNQYAPALKEYHTTAERPAQTDSQTRCTHMERTVRVQGRPSYCVSRLAAAHSFWQSLQGVLLSALEVRTLSVGQSCCRSFWAASRELRSSSCQQPFYKAVQHQLLWQLPLTLTDLPSVCLDDGCACGGQRAKHLEGDGPPNRTKELQQPGL